MGISCSAWSVANFAYTLVYTLAAFLSGQPCPLPFRGVPARSGCLHGWDDELPSTKCRVMPMLQERHERVLAATCAAIGALVELFAPALESVDSVDSRSAAPATRPDSQAPPDSGGAEIAGPEAGGELGTASSKDKGAGGPFLEGLGELLRQPALFKGVLQSKAAAVRRAGYALVALVARRCPSLLQVRVAALAHLRGLISCRRRCRLASCCVAALHD